MRRIPLVMLIVCASLLMPTASRADGEWPRFRGPNGSGVSTATTVPTEWGDDDFNWKVELPGAGHSSPVVWGERIYLMSADEETGTRYVLCLGVDDGRVLWSQEFPDVTHKKHNQNSFASGTPAVDEHHVYVNWATPESNSMVALTHEGEIAWRTELGKYQSGHGSGCSPIVYDELLVFSNEQPGAPALLALDRMTGQLRWSVDREPAKASYSTPCVFHDADGREELIFTSWKHGITSIDPASGAENWQIDVFGRDDAETRRSIGSPVVGDDFVVGTTGFVAGKKYLATVRPHHESTETTVEELYRTERAVPHVPTPLVKGNRLFLWDDKGIVTCLDATSGETVWQKRVGGNYWGSPVCAGDYLYAIDGDGTVVVLAASDEYRLVARNSLGESSRSTPAVAHGTMFLRTFSHLYSLGGAK